MTKTKATKEVKLPPNPFLHEILELASKQRSGAKKAEILQEYRNDALTSILIWNFDDSIISILPPGDVPYKENEVCLLYTSPSPRDLSTSRMPSSA